MTIDRISPIDPVSKLNKTEKTSRPEKKENTDSISFSDEAKSMGEIYKATESAKMAEDVRLDRIDEVKKKLEDPNYIDDEVVNTVAERIMNMFEL